MDSITKRILSWAPLRLSQAAKLVLNNSILVSISSHVMKCFKLPLSITNKIDSLISRFWWATNGDRGIHWARRHTIQCPKGMGGLGIRAVATFNEHYFSDKLLGCIVILNYYQHELWFQRRSVPYTQEYQLGFPKIALGGRRGLYKATNNLLQGF